jgi:hypothetical protein
VTQGDNYGNEKPAGRESIHTKATLFYESTNLTSVIIMLSANPLLLPLFGSVASAANLWATHYSGSINYLTFTGKSLTLTSSTKTGNNLPSWITYDSAGQKLYIPDEVFQGPSTGSLASFSIGNNGTLTANGKGTTPQGVVATALYGGADGKSFIANAH